MKRIGVLTSGGDAPGMNASIRAIVNFSSKHDIEVLGIKRGYKGLMDGDIERLDSENVQDILHQGGTILRSARALEFQEAAGQKKALDILKIFRIEGLIVIGGDGSFRGAQALSRLGFPTIGIPGTIDNDLNYTDFTIGFDTAVNTAVEDINRLNDTTFSHERVAIVVVMGRNCGDIALYSGIAGGADFILIPEQPYDLDAISNEIQENRIKGQNQNLIVVAEGVTNREDVGKIIHEKTQLDVRKSILGHVQRGGSPTMRDRVLGSRLGVRAVELLLEGASSRVVGMKGAETIDLDIDEALEIATKLNREEMLMLKNNLTM